MDSRPPRPEPAASAGSQRPGQPQRSGPPEPPAPPPRTSPISPPPDGAGQGSDGPALPKIIPFQSLARCGEEIWIENEGQVYRLRRTRQGKLILTK